MRTTFYLTPHPDGGWLGKQDGTEHYLIVSDQKQDALDHLVNLCKTQRPCSIIIHNDNAEVIEERTFGTLHFPE
jgi:hypothetical protein